MFRRNSLRLAPPRTVFRRAPPPFGRRRDGRGECAAARLSVLRLATLVHRRVPRRAPFWSACHPLRIGTHYGSSSRLRCAASRAPFTGLSRPGRGGLTELWIVSSWTSRGSWYGPRVEPVRKTGPETEMASMIRHCARLVLIAVVAATGVGCTWTSGNDSDDGTGGAGDASDIRCLATPTCDRGDGEVSSCPDAASCYTETECGETITCLPGAGDAGPVGPPDSGPTPDGGGASCPSPSSSNPDAGCLDVAVCCFKESTGETCRYANPCVAPDDPGSEWTCGSSTCYRDAGG